MPVSAISVQTFSLILSNVSLTTTTSSYCLYLVVFDINGLAEIEENDSKDTLTCDDNAHKTVLCSHSSFSKNYNHKLPN